MANVACALCNTAFGQRMPWHRFCGKPCRAKAERIAADRRAGLIAAQRMAAVPPLSTNEYHAACLACGRSGEETLVLTRPEVAALRSFPSCQHCGGRVLLESVLLTSGKTA